MDESGTRHSILRTPIIGRAGQAQTRPQKVVYGAVTVAFWAFWIYLWVPLLALLAWSLGIQQAYRYMVELEGYIEFISLVGMYMVVILFLGGALLLWAWYNIARFSGVERRLPKAEVTVEEVASGFRLNAADVQRWQSARRLVVTHDENGAISHVDDSPGQPAPA